VSRVVKIIFHQRKIVERVEPSRGKFMVHIRRPNIRYYSKKSTSCKQFWGWIGVSCYVLFSFDLIFFRVSIWRHISWYCVLCHKLDPPILTIKKILCWSSVSSCLPLTSTIMTSLFSWSSLKYSNNLDLRLNGYLGCGLSNSPIRSIAGR